MKHSYIIIDDSQESILKTHAVTAGFQNLHFIASATNYDDGLNLILEHNPKIVFLEIDPTDLTSKLSLGLVNDLYRYLKQVPKIIITTKGTHLAFEAIKYEVLDYLIKPVQAQELRKSILKFEKANFSQEQFFNAAAITAEQFSILNDSKNNEVSVTQNNSDQIVLTDSIGDVETNVISNEVSVAMSENDFIATKKTNTPKEPLIICVKSYGDYRFIEAKDICYIQADNNSTDIYLKTGEIITAFKTLKYFEGLLTLPFVRIHNSYIVNVDYVSRIHTGNSVCYIKGTTTKLPFSKSYKGSIDLIIKSIASGNYLEV